MTYLYAVLMTLIGTYVGYIFVRRAKTDEVISQLNRKPRTEEDDLIAKTQQELEDAKIHYTKSRTEFDHITGEGPDSKVLDE